MNSAHIDADFAHEILDDLYRYRRKHLLLAWVFWGSLGWFGAHRFYLGRDGTALLMMFTGGGLLVWWIVDAFLIGKFVRDHNAEQQRRRDEGLPPLELAFMPPLDKDVLQQPPAWTSRWQARDPAQQRRRFVGDLAVLLFAGIALGSLAGTDGAEEAIFAIVVVVATTAMGGATAGLQRFPLMRTLLRWTHRVRLFYYFSAPKSPPALLFRPIIGPLLAPFRKRDRAEVRLWVELGFAFTLVFLLLDIVENVMLPSMRGGADVGIGTLAGMWLKETPVTFFVTYAFAAPIGAVLTLYLLVLPTHTLPRLLCALTLAAVLTGAMLGGM
jgi:hypothetical protein